MIQTVQSAHFASLASGEQCVLCLQNINLPHTPAQMVDTAECDQLKCQLRKEQEVREGFKSIPIQKESSRFSVLCVCAVRYCGYMCIKGYMQRSEDNTLRQSLVFCYLQQVDFRAFSCLHLPSHHGNAGITDMGTTLSAFPVGAGDPNSDVSDCTASDFPTKPSPCPLADSYRHIGLMVSSSTLAAYLRSMGEIKSRSLAQNGGRQLS